MARNQIRGCRAAESARREFGRGVVSSAFSARLIAEWGILKFLLIFNWFMNFVERGVFAKSVKFSQLGKDLNFRATLRIR
jgi:hypothetical protein